MTSNAGTSSAGTSNAGTSGAQVGSTPLELTAGAVGNQLTVSLTSVAERPVAVWFEVEGPNGPLYDCLSVELTGAAGRRTLLFTGDRNSSTSGRVVLGPSESVVAELDLLAWAQAEINGGAGLASGSYRATVIYRCGEPDCWSGEVASSPVPVEI